MTAGATAALADDLDALARAIRAAATRPRPAPPAIGYIVVWSSADEGDEPPVVWCDRVMTQQEALDAAMASTARALLTVHPIGGAL